MAGLNIEIVTRRFDGVEVLEGASLDVADGESVSLAGSSGCGNSTLLRIIAGLEEQTAGDIKIARQSVVGRRAADRNLSMMFQSNAPNPHLSAVENTAVPLCMRRLTRAQR